jgi:hypothetical protein
MSTPTLCDFPNSDTFTIQNYAIYPLDSYWNAMTSGGSTPAPIAGPNRGDLSYYYLGVTAKRAIRLKNGGVLPDGGLTVVSGNPVCIQGDYNTGTTSSLQPASNNASLPDPTKPTVADAVNILSNAWLDSRSGSTPAASPTTLNVAIISGTVPTGNGYYSGGLENFPRFPENWDGKVSPIMAP